MIMPVVERPTAIERQARRASLRASRVAVDGELGRSIGGALNLMPDGPLAEQPDDLPQQDAAGAVRAREAQIGEPRSERRDAGPQAAALGQAAPCDPEPREIPRVPAKSIETLVKLFRLLADDTRLRILYFLSHRRELHVRALCDLLHQSQPAVSHHLALLREADLIRVRRHGKHNFYRLTPGNGRQRLTTVFTAVKAGTAELDLDGLALERESMKLAVAKQAGV